MARRNMLQRRDAKHNPNQKPVQIPDNSEPWLPHKPRSLADCFYIADQINQHTDQWKQDFLPRASSESKPAATF